MAEIEIARDRLVEAVRAVAKVTPWTADAKKPGLIHLQVVGGIAALVSVDHEMQVEATMSAERCTGDAVAAVPLAPLAALVEKLPGGAVVRLDTQDGVVVVIAGRMRSRLPGRIADALPCRPAPAGLAHQLPASALASGLAIALPASIDDAARPYLAGVHLRDTGAGISFEGQDGNRIHASDQAGDRIHASATIPRRAARIIRDLLPEEGDAAVMLTERAIQITAGAIRVTASLIDGRFPDVAQKLSVSCERHLRARADELLADLDLVCVAASQRDRDFRLDLGPTCEASAFRVTEGTPTMGAVELRGAFTGTPLAIGFQLPLVRDALALFEGCDVVWSMGGPEDASVIHSPDRPGVEALVSPFRLAPDHIRKAA